MRVTDLRIAFDVQKTADESANTATIWIWNLTDKNRGKLKKEFDRVKIEAGYQGTLGSKGNVGLIFDGFISDVYHDRRETDIISMIECGDGDKGLRQGVVKKTLPKKTKVSTLIKEAQDGMPDVSAGEQKGVDKLPDTTRPVVMCGPASRELDKLGRSHGFLWSIQDGALEICPVNESFGDVVVISPKTGMVGKPTQTTDGGMIVKCLLNPRLKIYRQIEVQSEVLEMNDRPSRYRIDKLVFSGDNGVGVNPGDFLAEIYASDPSAAAEGESTE